MKKGEFDYDALPRKLRNYVDHLGLTWRIRCFYDPDADAPRMGSFAKAREHHIYFDTVDARLMEEWTHDLVHEFCHAKLAEDIDAIFAVTLFDKRHETKDSDFVKQASMLLDATDAVCDVWVNDLVAGFDPDFARKDIETWTDNMLNMVGLKPDLLAEALDKHGYWHHAIGCALNIAMIERNRLRSYFSNDIKLLKEALARILGDDYVDVAERLSALLTSLPNLPVDRDQAVSLYQEKVQKAIGILNYSIKAWIAKDANKELVWHIEWIRESAK